MNQSLHDLFESLPDAESEQVEKAPRQRSPFLLPWILVGVVAVVAIVVSIVLVNSARGGDDDGSATPPPGTQTSEPTATDRPTTGPTPTQTPTETPDEPDERPDDEVPEASIGDDPILLPVEQWGVEVQISRKLGSLTYVIDADDTLTLSSPLIDSLPASCADMRSGFGFHRTDSGAYEVVRPAERCTEAPEIYDEIWGQLAQSVETIRPAG